jgi:GNAT superfamily N-acetyltransferase/catechol 2,3-dioxygenase-like lactoylglutathione lyase family enzyme
MTRPEQARANHGRIKVRAAVAADHDQVRAVLAASYAQFRSDVTAHLHELYIADLCDLNGRLEGAQLLVATADETVLGTVTLHPRPSVGVSRWPPGWAAIRALAVHPAHRGHGIARRLIEAARARATNGAAHSLGLHTAPFMTDAIRLYEDMGFTRAPDLDIEAGRLLETNGEPAPGLIAYRLILPARSITGPRPLKENPMQLTRGVNHIAVLTDDLERFVEFYSTVFGLEVAFTETAPAFRHAILRTGPDSWLHPAEVFGGAHGTGSPAMFERGHLDHLALTADSPEAFEVLRGRLMQRGSTDGSVEDLGAFHALWFDDPDGMRVELTLIVDPRLEGIHAPEPLGAT